jgi:hypothetical protein
MTKAIKAALLSALVLPGAGHFFLKKPIIGLLLAALAFAGLVSIVANILEHAQTIADKILSGEVPADISALSNLASSEAISMDIQQLNIATTLLLASWVIGIVDAYRVGRQLDKADA